MPENRRYRETPELGAAVRRLLRVIGGRLADEDPDDLETLIVLELELRQAWATAIAGLRASGWSDRDIGAALGVTRQAVEQRWPRDVSG